jgi:hypothetical protein
MENSITKIKNWVLASFQFITLGLLVFATVLIIKQQNDMGELKNRIKYLDGNIDEVKSKMDDIESKIDDVEGNISSEIDDVKRTVRLWSN